MELQFDLEKKFNLSEEEAKKITSICAQHANTSFEVHLNTRNHGLKQVPGPVIGSMILFLGLPVISSNPALGIGYCSLGAVIVIASAFFFIFQSYTSNNHEVK